MQAEQASLSFPFLFSLVFLLIYKTFRASSSTQQPSFHSVLPKISIYENTITPLTDPYSTFTYSPYPFDIQSAIYFSKKAKKSCKCMITLQKKLYICSQTYSNT